MGTIVDVESLRLSPTAARFEGRDHGSPISLFVTSHPPGAAVPLHRHPYVETFVVQEGRAEFTVDGATIQAQPGQIVVVPEGAAHGFRSVGETNLCLVSIHPCDHVQQEWLDPA